MVEHLPPNSLNSGLQLVATHTPATQACVSELDRVRGQAAAVDADRPQKLTFVLKSRPEQRPLRSEKPLVHPSATHLPSTQACTLEPANVAVQLTALPAVVPQLVICKRTFLQSVTCKIA